MGCSAEHTRFQRFESLGNLELLTARFTRQTFAPHFHEGHVVGVIEGGALGFDYRGEKVVASTGQINLADPGEVHNGFAASDTGWQYRMFYLAPGQLEKILEEILEKSTSMPFFGRGALRDDALANALHGLHVDFTNPAVTLLEKESRFYGLVHNLVARHIRAPFSLKAPGRERRAVSRIKAYIRDRSDTCIRLSDLAAVSGMSRYYMLRMFKASTSMTPHAFLTQVRAEKARDFMRTGGSLAEAALESGFYDQSHLNRVFKKIYGITPGQYSAAGMIP